MDEEQKIRTIDQFNNWCDHCQLFAVQFYIWNTEATQLETIIAEALNTLPGKVGTSDWESAIRTSFGQLQHCDLRDIVTQLSLLIESPCKTEVCQEECAKFRSKK